MRMPHLLAALLLLAVLAGGLALTLINPATFSSPGTADLVSGAWAAGYAAAYEAALALRTPARNTWGSLRYLLFGEGEPGLLIGDGGWLFSTEEFVTADETGASMSAALASMRETRDALAARGIALVVALVPTKAELYPERRARYSLPPSIEGRYEQARQGLVALGIDAPDLLSALRDAKTVGDVFLRTDTHWTPHGARAAAAAIARSVKPILDARGSARETYVERQGAAIERRGDLLAFLPLGLLSRALGPRPDTVQEVTAVARAEPSASGSGGEGLFETLSIPVALVGTSYSATGIWNFGGALRIELEADVLEVAQEGKGPFLPMRGYLGSPAIEDPKPDIVIWEIPERYLAVDVPLGIRSLER
jgi:alginate O-acetyltransferase complex protein AlgJ